MLKAKVFSLFLIWNFIALTFGKAIVEKYEKDGVKTYHKTEVNQGGSYSYKSSYSSYSYSFSTYSSSVSSSYYYSYGYSASGFQPEQYPSYTPRCDRPSTNSWVEQICDLLPFRSAYVSNRCFFTIAQENLNGVPINDFVRGLLKDDFMQEVKITPRLANVDREEVYQELVRVPLFQIGVKYEVGKYYKGGNSIVVGDPGKNSGFVYEFGETHTCPDGFTRFSGQCYKFIQEPKTYFQASDVCEKLGGALPAIEDDDENRFVASIIHGQSTWLATYWPQGSDDWEVAQPMFFFEQGPSAAHAPSAKHAVLFGTKTNPSFWFGYWANMDGNSIKQPFVCVTNLIIGSYPDIIEPYPSGENVTIIVSQLNSTFVVPDKCCTASLPDIEVEANTYPTVTQKRGDENDANVTIEVVPIPTTSPTTQAPQININNTLVELYRYVCKEGTCEAHHFYSTSFEGSLPCCEIQGYTSKIIDESNIKLVKRSCPRLQQLNGFYSKRNGGKFILTLDGVKSEMYANDRDFIKESNFGYCSPKQNYCGATLPLWEVEIEYKHKKGNQFLQYSQNLAYYYTTSDEEIDFLVSSNHTSYKALTTNPICWTWPTSKILKGPIVEKEMPKDCLGQGTSKKPIIDVPVYGTPRTPKGGEEGVKKCMENSCGRNAECSVVLNEITCTCKVGYVGDTSDLTRGCEVQVTCNEKSCGPNAVCQVKNNAILCECKLGFSGDPFDLKDGCRVAVTSSCTWGDPHYTTFDHSKFDWHGTCPYIFSMNANPGNIAPYGDFKVKARNTNKWSGTGDKYELAGVARVAEVEVEFPDLNLVIHIDVNHKLYVNGDQKSYDYYYPNAVDPKVTIINVQNTIYIKRFDQVEIKFSNPGMTLCVTVPDVPQFQGPDQLVGLAGNRDRKCDNDFKLRNGTILSTNQKCDVGIDYKPAQNFGDDWILLKDEPFMNTIGAKMDECQKGGVAVGCDKEKLGPSFEACQPINDAKNGQGPFAGCQALGQKLDGFYEACAFDLCMGMSRCSAFATFFAQCQDSIPFMKGIDTWRQQTSCENELKCPANSHYTPCASQCALSCQKCQQENGVQKCWGEGVKIQKCEYQSKKVCNGGECRWQNEKVCPPPPQGACVDKCTEGCECDKGYVMDKNNGFFTCVNQCPAGSYMPASCEINSIWNEKTSTPPCPHGGTYYPAGNKCILILKKSGNHQQHRDMCKCFGGDLASIHSQDEHDFVYSKHHYSFIPLLDLAAPLINAPNNPDINYYGVRIGLYDPESRNQWGWIDKSPFSFVKWGALEPNYEGKQTVGREYCGCFTLQYTLFKNEAKTWGDTGCDTVLQETLCNYPSMRPPQPKQEAPSPCVPNLIWNDKAPTGQCPHGGTYYHGGHKCLAIVKKAGNMQQHRDMCRCFGGDLTSIHSQDEYDFLYKLAAPLIGAPNNPKINYYCVRIGLYDPVSRNQWGWLDKSPFNFVKWGQLEPNYEGHQTIGKEYCGCFTLQYTQFKDTETKTWGDTGCDVVLQEAVCSYPANGPVFI